MSHSRFKAIKVLIRFAFYDHNLAESDPYFPVSSLVDDFNDNRKKTVAASIDIIVDESMCSFRPRTTATSDLPNISFIFRKPKPLGVEFKV